VLKGLSNRRLYWRLSVFCEAEIDLQISPNELKPYYSCAK